MTSMRGEPSAAQQQFAILDEIARRNQTWGMMAAKYTVENPLPPWKTSLDALCDVLDHSCATAEELDFTFKQRRDEEDELSATRYADLPFPERQLAALAHSLLARGVFTENDLRERLAVIRARLET